MHLLERCSKNLKDGCARLGVLAAHDAQDCFALRRGRSFVNDRDRFPVTFMNRAGPTEDAAKFEAIELGVSMMALVDGDTDNGLAVAVGRQRIELTRAPVRAIAMREVSSFDHPRDVVHCGLLLLQSRSAWLFTAGAFGFLVLIHSAARPPRTIRRISPESPA